MLVLGGVDLWHAGSDMFLRIRCELTHTHTHCQHVNFMHSVQSEQNHKQQRRGRNTEVVAY